MSLPDTETFTTNSFAIVRNEFTPTCHTPGRKRERLVALQQGDSPADAFRRWAADEGGDVDNFGDVSWTGERDADLLEWVDEDEYAGIELRATCGDDGERLAVTFTARRERGFRAKMRR